MSFNVGKTMNQQQLVDAVKLISKTYYYLKPSELKYCFDNAKVGKYGKLFDRIDVAVICDFIEQYLIERVNEFIRIRTNEKNGLPKYNTKFENIILPVLKSVEKQSKEKEVKKENKRNDNFKDLFYNECMKRFDKLRRDYCVKDTGMRFVSRNGLRYDAKKKEYYICNPCNLEEFVNYKLLQIEIVQGRWFR